LPSDSRCEPTTRDSTQLKRDIGQLLEWQALFRIFEWCQVVEFVRVAPDLSWDLPLLRR
jgi:hypothetical protein